MKQRIQLVAYLAAMAVLITAAVFMSGSKGHNICPVCNHSIAKEGVTTPTIVNNNQQ